MSSYTIPLDYSQINLVLFCFSDKLFTMVQRTFCNEVLSLIEPRDPLHGLVLNLESKARLLIQSQGSHEMGDYLIVSANNAHAHIAQTH